MRSIFVMDGYTDIGIIPAHDDFPGLKFKYRRCTGPERREFHAVTNDKIMAKAIEVVFDHVENQTVTAIDADKKPVADPVRLTDELMRKLDADYWDGLVNTVLGYQGPSLEDAEKNLPAASGSN